MDDYKREIYMRVLRTLQEKPPCIFVCVELQNTLFEDPDFLDNSVDTLNTILDEFFPEFDALFDGTIWSRDGWCEKINKSMAWWEDWWYEPRIRALECILRDSA